MKRWLILLAVVGFGYLFFFHGWNANPKPQNKPSAFRTLTSLDPFAPSPTIVKSKGTLKWTASDSTTTAKPRDFSYTGQGGELPTNPVDLQAYFDAENTTYDATTFAYLKQMGRDVVTADLTGVGRGKFPGFWPPQDPSLGGYHSEVDDLKINGIEVLPVKGSTNSANISVVWQGTTSTGKEQQITTIVAINQGGTWKPTKIL